jgi:hypothetical protein
MKANVRYIAVQLSLVRKEKDGRVFECAEVCEERENDHSEGVEKEGGVGKE